MIIGFSWGDATGRYLLTPEREPTIDQSKDCQIVQFGESIEFLS